MPHISLDGISLHYQQAGCGPDVVLVHAFTSNLAAWMLTSLVDVLAADFRVTCYDLRGHGASDVPPAGYTSADMAEDLRGLHARLQLQPAFLVGHSFGGVIAAHAAILHPRIVRGIILSDTYFPCLAHLEPDMVRARAWDDLRRSLLKCGIELGERVDFGRLFSLVAALTASQVSRLQNVLGPPGVRWLVHTARLADTTAADDAFAVAGLTAERLVEIRQPVVALYDEHSSFTATCRYLAQHLRDCTVDQVPGARHLAPVQNAEAFVPLVHKHLLRMARSPPPS
jgi:pimeloyl-ACP methyl ester carboxylesterase